MMNACGTGQTIGLIINNEWTREIPGATKIMEGDNIDSVQHISLSKEIYVTYDSEILCAVVD